MFSLPNFSVKRPVTMFVAVLTLITFGISSIFSMQMESIPSMSLPYLMVITAYPDASPDEIDEMVTQMVEGSLMTVEGVKSITSTSQEGMSMVFLEFDYDTDTDQKNNDVTAVMSMLPFPDGCQDPIVIAMDTANLNSSIMSLSIDTTGDDRIVSYVEENIVTEIERISGVADVSITGDTQNYVSVLLDEAKLSQYGVNMAMVASAIATAEYEQTLGQLNRGDISLSVVGSKEYNNYYDLGTIPISLATGDIIYLSDLSAISMIPEEVTSYSRRNGQSTIGLSITQEQTGNTVAITSAIADLVDDINNSNEGVDIHILSDSGQMIYDNIQTVVSSLMTGLVIAVFVLMFFFGEWKSSLIVAITMPLSVFAALVMMSFTGMTINMMSLGGLVVGIGMMVDSSIVVIDSCFNAREENLGFRDSVAKGANMVTSSIIASTITTVVVFLPIALMDGMSGQIFWDVCMTIVFSLIASLIGALTVVPLLFVKLRPIEKTEGFAGKMMITLKEKYTKLLEWALDRRKTVVLISIGILILSVVLYAQIPMELMPSDFTNSITFAVETKTGLTVDEGNKILTELESYVLDDQRVESYSVSVGGTNMMGSTSGASLSVTMKEAYEDEMDAFIAEIEEKATALDNCRVSASKGSGMPGMSFGVGGGVAINLQGSDLQALDAFADEVVAEISTLEAYEYVSSNLSDGAPRAKISVDPILAGSVGMTPSGVLSSVGQKLSGMKVMTLIQDGIEYDVKVEFDPELYTDMSDLNDLMVDTPTGNQVALTDLSTISYEVSPSAISRIDSEYIVTITATPKDDTANVADLSTQLVALIHNMGIPDEVSIYEGDEMQQMMEEFTAIFGALLIAIYLVFAVMAVQFESLVFSLVVMISVPFAAAGAFLGLYVTGNSISMTSLLGLVMLAGIVVNNAIVLIDHAQMMKDEGHDTREALLLAGQARLRPILMSSLTTIVGLVPMALGVGGAISMMQGLAYTVIGGLTLSTLLTLVLIPTFYLMFDADARRARKEERKAKREAKKAEKEAKI